MSELVNIILPILNRPTHTKQCLQSLYESTPKELFTLTVIDDGSDMDTKILLAELKKKYGFEHIVRSIGDSRGPGYSRNEGAKSVKNRGKYIYHCDNDVYYKAGWLEKLIAVYESVSKHRVALLGASCHPYLQNNARILVVAPHSINGINVASDMFDVGIKDAVSGYSQLMTWEIWDRFGEFHTQEGLEKKTGRSDDWEYCQRINQAGLLCGSVEPELIVPCGKTDTYGDPAVGQETFKNPEGVYVG